MRINKPCHLRCGLGLSAGASFRTAVNVPRGVDRWDALPLLGRFRLRVRRSRPLLLLLRGRVVFLLLLLLLVIFLRGRGMGLVVFGRRVQSALATGPLLAPFAICLAFFSGALYGAGTSIFARRGMTGSSGSGAGHWIRFALSIQS